MPSAANDNHQPSRRDKLPGETWPAYLKRTIQIEADGLAEAALAANGAQAPRMPRWPLQREFDAGRITLEDFNMARMIARMWNAAHREILQSGNPAHVGQQMLAADYRVEADNMLHKLEQACGPDLWIVALQAIVQECTMSDLGADVGAPSDPAAWVGRTRFIDAMKLARRAYTTIYIGAAANDNRAGIETYTREQMARVLALS